MPSAALTNVPIFAGQGNAVINSLAAREQAWRDASTSEGSLLLAACFVVFRSEISSLSQTELLDAGIDISDFKKKNALLDVPTERYLSNPIITGTTLFLLQSLRYLAYIESSRTEDDSPILFNEILEGNLEKGLGVLGFSSGILPAVVVATSFDTISYISRSVETYRLAFWIGVRTQQFRHHNIIHDSPAPWSFVFLGLDKKSAEEAVAAFSSNAPLAVTAVLDDRSVTISGRPDVLEAFRRTLSASVVTHKTSMDTLYHYPHHADTLRERVLADITTRGIKFPEYLNMKVPVRSTFTGSLLMKENAGSLVEAILDMILTQPVNWDLVTNGLAKAAPPDENICLLNFGPGTGLTRNLERAFPRNRVSILDLTTGDPDEKVKPKQDSIAIVGMSVHMPGARDTEELWRVLEEGINTVSSVPEHRFKVSDYNYPRDAKTKRQMKVHTGNFIDGVDEFDHKFFETSPREARSMDPQQRILLQVAYEALENAGYVPNSTRTWQTSSIGCYIGAATHDYLQNLRDEIDVYYSTGTLKAFLSGRISYAMQLSGPSIVVDTACSSSAVAVYQGCRALMNGDCSAAIVGGINVISSPDMMLGLDRAHFLSPTGQCKAFDASADGYSRSEGCGVFVLKKLSDATAESDNILGVIRGVEINQSGSAHSITHPHMPTQVALFRTLLKNTCIEANRVSVVEAHGTGTQTGDPKELESIRSVFAIKREPENPLHITSVKANIGHLEAASGSAGLAKLLLMFKHRIIPPVISLRNLNPLISPLKSDHTVIDTVRTEWKTFQGNPRVAMLNNFGAAGSNAAMLIEEFCSAKRAEPLAGLAYVFGLSAKTETALEELRGRYIGWLKNPRTTSNLADIAYTMTARRRVYKHRIAVQASTEAELIEKLGKASPVRVQADSGRIVFIFSGQGGQYLGMGESLYETSDLFRKHVDECHSFLVASGFPGVKQILLAGERGSGLTTLEEFEAYQAAIFSLEYALAKLWMSWGLTPAAVVGHSLGEYAALVISGVISLKSALTIIANRVRLMVQKCAIDTTSMLAVHASLEVVTEAIKASPKFSELTIACYNSATDCVVAGPTLQIEAFKTRMDAGAHCKSVPLSVPFGFHSSAMEPLLEDLTAVASKIIINTPTIPVISNVFGEVVVPGDHSVFNAQYFSRHCAEPVQFHKGIRSLLSLPEFREIDAWLEIGPHATTLPMLKASTTAVKGAFLASLRKGQPAWSTLAASGAQLYLTGIPVKWRQAFSHVNIACVELPSYPFARTRFWVPFKEPMNAATNAIQDPAAPVSLACEFKMLHSWAQYPSRANKNVAIFEAPINYLAGLICGHAVGGIPICPASVYFEQVLSGIELAKRHLCLKLGNSHPILRKIEFAKPLVYDASVPRTVIISVSLNDGCGVFRVASQVGHSEESVHVHGTYGFQAVLDTTNKFNRTFPVISRQIKAVQEPRGEEFPDVFCARTMYEVIFPRVVDYSKEYHTAQTLTVEPSGMEAVANVKLPVDCDKGPYIVHPVFMDTLLHVAGFVANMQGGLNDVYICTKVGTVKVIPELVDKNASYTVYINNSWVESEGITFAESYAILDSHPQCVVAHLKGIQFRRMRLDRLKKALAHTAGGVPQVLGSYAPIAPTTPNSDTSGVSSPRILVPLERPIEPLRLDVDGQNIKQLLADILEVRVSDITDDAEFESLGLDSLASIEALGALKCEFHVDLPGNFFSSYKTARAVQSYLSAYIRA
ncbi:ketoacyl-synt-domain-containing protein [Macrolepiota fuliginosa MF-IS2]|uniref:Ketoacyl-synt-domain-containing protein n=1 Tax=Macrolepiota fuliginosa MF-IS2 TaxID=1400762 RepID=A0A9P6C820_9AGAR|nr:ketoacyl-synt-domain-containing protein [Macrolepiota fuliginosa MF-IS2]